MYERGIKPKKYRVTHIITLEFDCGIIEADDKEQAEELAYDELPLSTEEYHESEKWLVED